MKVAPCAGSALHRDRAAVIPDDAVGRGEPEPRPPPPVLGGEKRLENPLPDRGVDAAPGVAHRDLDIPAGGDPGRGGLRLVEGARSRVSTNSSPPPGIACQALTKRLSSTCSICARSISTVARSPAQAACTSISFRVRLNISRLACTRPLRSVGTRLYFPPWANPRILAESSAPLSTQCSMSSRRARRGLAGLQAQEQQRDVPLDAHQDVVEVVRDAPGERADGAHPLGGGELLLEPLLLADVPDEVQGRRPPLPVDRDRVELRPERRAVLAPHPQRVGRGDLLPPQRRTWRSRTIAWSSG